MAKRRKFTSEFKTELVLEVLNRKYTTSRLHKRQML